MTSTRSRIGAPPTPTPERARRRPFTTVHDWGELVADLARHEPPRVLLVDVDPAVAGWGADAGRLRDGFARVEGPLADVLASDGVVVWTSNSTRIADELGPPPYYTPAGNRLLLGAGKPGLRTLRRQLNGLLQRPGVVVVGDQWLFDGLLARRLEARFVRWVDPGARPWWSELQLLAGSLVVRPFHRRG